MDDNCLRAGTERHAYLCGESCGRFRLPWDRGDREGMRRTDRLVRAIHFPRTLGEPCLCACWTLLWNTQARPRVPSATWSMYPSTQRSLSRCVSECKVSALNSQR